MSKELPRMYRESDLVNMGVSSLPDQILTNIVRSETRASDLATAKRRFRIDMKNMIFPDAAGKTNFTLDDAKQQIQDCIDIGADFIVSSGPRNESISSIKNRISLLKSVSGKPKIFVIHYSADMSGILLLQENPDAADYVGIHIGSYVIGSPGLNKVFEKILYIKQFLQKKAFLFGAPIKVHGDHQKDIRFFPFHSLICDGWVRYWAPIVPSDTLKYIDRDDYICKTYEACIGKFTNRVLPGLDMTPYDFFKHGSSEQKKEYEQMVLDEAEATLQSASVEDLQAFLLARMHPAYIDLFLMCWKVRMNLDLIDKTTELMPEWNSIENRTRLSSRLDRAAPFKVNAAARTALKWLQENVEAQQKPTFEAFIKILDKGLSEGQAEL